MSKLLLILLILLPPSFIFILLITSLYLLRTRQSHTDLETLKEDVNESELLQKFVGGEELTTEDLLEAEGEVIGKSRYGTIYKATILNKRRSCKGFDLLLLRFVKPNCCNEDCEDVIRLLGSIRDMNLVPVLGVYVGVRGEKLLVHPFYGSGNLAQFIKDTKVDCHEWKIIHKISIGIARGLNHIHSNPHKPLIHGNLKSKNILLDHNLNPYISDYGLHLLLNPAAGQEMIDSAAVQGYKAPEMIKMKDCNVKTDIYSMGVILLEILTGREPVNIKSSSLCEDFYSMNIMRNAIRVTEERILRLFELAMACCSPSPDLRPSAKELVAKLEEIGS